MDCGNGTSSCGLVLRSRGVLLLLLLGFTTGIPAHMFLHNRTRTRPYHTRTR